MTFGIGIRVDDRPVAPSVAHVAHHGPVALTAKRPRPGTGDMVATAPGPVARPWCDHRRAALAEVPMVPTDSADPLPGGADRTDRGSIALDPEQP